MKKSQNITSIGELLTKKGVKARIDISKLSTHLAHDFYNQRLLKQFKRLLKDKNIPYVYYRHTGALIVEQFYLVLFANDDGRFSAYNKAGYNDFSQQNNYSVTFEANNTIELINKLLRFNIIGPGSAVQMVQDKTLPKPKPKKPPEIDVLIKEIPI